VEGPPEIEGGGVNIGRAYLINRAAEEKDAPALKFLRRDRCRASFARS